MLSFQQKIISKIRFFLSLTSKSFMCSWLDYCNAIYSGISQGSLHRFQLVKNSAARLITDTKKYKHIRPCPSLHWLPVSFHIDLNILLLAFRALGLGTVLIQTTCQNCRRAIFSLDPYDLQMEPCWSLQITVDDKGGWSLCY